MSDLILVPCEGCARDARHWPSMLEMGFVCPDCEGAGWLLVEGAPISLEDLERMAPWADVPSFSLPVELDKNVSIEQYISRFPLPDELTGRPLESGEIDGIH